MAANIDFIYLSQDDVLKAGGDDMEKCIWAIEQSFRLFDKGDYIQGGIDGMSHGCMLFPPEESPFEGMPLAGPDRRFMAMPAYLGGPFRKAGCKWYGSNRENMPKGLPRSILMLTLNDPDTGAPLAHMSANLISSMRTGAAPGVGAKYLANPDSEVIGVIGCGAINRACFIGIKTAVPALKTVKVYDLYESSSKKFAEFINRRYPDMTVTIAESVEETVRNSDIISSVTSGASQPEIKYEWLKEGVYVSLPSSIKLDFDVVPNTRQVTDCLGMLREWVQEGIVASGGDDMAEAFFREADGTGAYWHHAVKAGRFSWDDVQHIGAIVNGKIPGRQSKEEKIFFTMGGLPLHDVAWGTMVYENALKLGLGTKLNLWDEPYML